LNNAVIDSTGLAQVKAKVMYPTRILIDEPCDYHEDIFYCENGLITYNDAEEGKVSKTCPSCHGTGWKQSIGISSEIRINPNSAKVDEQGTAITNANNVMAYISPPTTSAEFLRREIDMAIVAAERKLHLRAEPRESGNISATEKNRDKENTEAFIKPISDQIWDILTFAIDTMGKITYGAEYDSMKPTIYRPDSFDMISTEDVVEMMAEAQEKKLPTVMRQAVMRQYLEKDSKASPKEAMLMELIYRSDRLITMTMEEAIMALTRRTAKAWEVFLHMNPEFIIEEVMREAPNGVIQDIDEAVTQIKAKAQEMTPSDDDFLPAAIEPPDA
jgi:hypothetical protein